LGALVYSKVENGIEHSGIIGVRHRIVRYEKGASGGRRWLGLVGNENVAPQILEVERAIIEKEAIVFYRLEEAALRLIGYAAECAGRVRDNVDVFWIGLKTGGPIEGVISNVASVIDCVNLTEVLIAHQDLPSEGPEA
jgi:hypothetical protein